jgi:hypothetical protein
MKYITITICMAILLTGMTAIAQKTEKKKDEAKFASNKENNKEKWKVVDSATAMKNWMEYMTPGKAHEMLSKADGEWIGEMTMWMAPGAPPTKTLTTATNKMIMGGRYQLSTFKGDFDGMPFEGQSTVAFDNAQQVFISSWIDNMGTGIMNMEGKWDEATKSILFKGRMVCPTNGQEADVKETFKFIDDNTQLMEMWGPDPVTGKSFKTMEIRFTRKK